VNCPNCKRPTCTGDLCATCRLENASDEFTRTILEIVGPVDMNDLPNPYDDEESTT
jgi:hypothetical protein